MQREIWPKTLTKSLDIRGPGAGILSISGGDRDPGLGVAVSYDASVTISGLTFKDTKRNGECFITNAGTLNLTNSMVSDNTTFPGSVITPAGEISCRGGGIENTGMLKLTNSIVSGNMGPNGGGIFNRGTLTLINSTISGNKASQGDGGGIWNGLDTKYLPNPTGGTLTLTNSTISGNLATGDGGGIYNDGALTITNSTILENKAFNGGGGIYNGRSSIVDGKHFGGMLTLINSTISDNTAPTDGGGIVFGGTQASITFCTIYGNKAAHDGGGISIQDFNFSNNVTHSQVEMRNNIVVANKAYAGSDIWGTLISDGYNLFQDTSGATFDPSTSTQHRTDKLLSANDLSRLFVSPVGLRDNHGPTKTYALAPGSPAIDAIPLQYCQLKVIFNSQSRMYTDQRGVRRPDGNERACDIGAYEYVD